MSPSAQNRVPCVVRRIEPAEIGMNVVIEIGNGGPEIVAVLAKEAIAKLGLEVGRDAYAVFKASSVSLGL